jgi:periplasmic protein TonB
MEHAAIHPADPSLKNMLLVSAILHGVLITAMVVGAVTSGRGESWGSAGEGSVKVGLVGSVPAVPLPRPDAISESRVADESKAFYKAEPKPKVAPPEKAVPLPEFEKSKPLPPSRPSKLLEDNTTPPPNAVPAAPTGSPPAVPYSTYTIQGATQGGMGFTGTGGGDFASRYAWYVDAVRNRISSNWVQSLVDPSVQFAPRAVVDFQILRDGTITGIQVTHSSGNESVDRSAVRAIQSSSPVTRLPNDYSGKIVNVEFWFEFRR